MSATRQVQKEETILTHKMSRGVSIAGAGYTPMGFVTSSPEMLNFSERELAAWACMEAMEDAGITAKDIDAYYLSISGPNYDAKMKSGAPFFADWMGLRGKSAVFHDEGCGGQAFGLQMAVDAVASGQYDCVITVGVNINTTVPRPCYPPYIRQKQDNDVFWEAMYTGVDAAYEKPAYGGAGPMEAILVRYAIDHKLTRDDINETFVNYLIGKRKEALLNPKALRATMTYEEEAKQFGFDNVHDYLFSNKYNPPMGTLLRAQFMGQGVDAASAIIVMSTEKAMKLAKRPIEVAATATSTSQGSAWCQIPLPPNVKMFSEAYDMAGITDPYHEVEYMGIHDCPATSVIACAEDAGYFRRGEAWRFMRDGRVNFDGDKPLTTTGGRTQSGHPRSPAFGIEVAEAISQMRGENGARQIAKPPKISVIWGGGSGYSTGICVLRSL